MKSAIAFCVATFVLVQLFHDSEGQDATCQREDYPCCARSCLMSRMCANNTGECGGRLVGNNGTLRYPAEAGERYPNGKNCGWLIIVDEPKVIRITMRSFDLESSTNCVYDFLQYHDGPSPLSTAVYRFCGSGVQPEMNFRSTYNQLYLWFKSDNSVNGLGFELTWSAVDAFCDAAYENATYGVVSSPGYPESYSRNRDCTWLVHVFRGNRIQFQFAHLQLQNSNNCSADYLSIYDGTSTSRYCGNETPPPFLTSAHMALVNFHSDSSIVDKGFRLTYGSVQQSPDVQVQGCGGTLTAPNGTFSSPNYPSNYDNNLNCEWIIRINPNNRMILSFSDFELESQSNCNYDSVEVYDGANGTAPLVGRYCGTSAPPNLTSSSNEVYIRFRTDSSIVNRGFRAQYSTKESVQGCGGTLTASNGTFTSPNYPNNYENNLNCEWIIRINPNNRMIISFSDFELESQSNCNYDSVEIYDGANATAPSLGRYCGTSAPANLTSNSHEVYIRFRTDSSIVNRGFTAQYSTQENVQVQGCGGTLTASNGTFTSPNYPNNYENNQNCEWIVRTNRRSRVFLSFSDFQLESHSSCNYDSVEVYDGANRTAPLLGRFCGNAVPPNLTSSSHEVYIRFSTDSSVVDRGFVAQYSVREGCGRTLTASNGTFTSPNYPDNYENNLNCEWFIRINPNKKMIVSFSDFQLESHSSCSYDSVEVYDGANGEALLVGRYCGTSAPPDFESSSNEVYIRFKTDSSIVSRGFSAQYRTKQANCGGEHTQQLSGNVSSPNFPNSYPANAQCLDIIRLPMGYVINVTFNSFDLESQSNCNSDYLQVRDGSTEDSPEIGKYCGDRAPANIVSTYNELSLEFVSNEMVQRNGFHAGYQGVNRGCGGMMTYDNGRFTSPLYPENYPHSTNCSWFLRAPPGSNVRLTFESFRLENDVLCRYDYVLVENSNGTKMGQYCAYTIPPVLTSSENKMFVKFVSDSTVNEKGFVANYAFVNATG